MEVRGNHCVRRYHGSIGKRCITQDEFLEHDNHISSECPMPRSLTGFATQSIYVSVTLMIKQFCNLQYTLQFDANIKLEYTNTVKSTMTPEKTLIRKLTI